MRGDAEPGVVPLSGDELTESRLYTFLDEKREFALYFLEGQRLIQDLALLHASRGEGFGYFRDAVLSVAPMIALIQRGEQIGFYLDSEEPFFRLKIEASHQGDMRSALFPEDLSELPRMMWGTARVQRVFPDSKPPYTSVLRIEGLPLRSIVNRVLTDSYQVNSVVLVSQRADQSAMLHQLPPLPGRSEYEYSSGALRERASRLHGEIDLIFGRAHGDAEEIDAAFGGLGFRRLSDRTVRFRCGCSRERMLFHLRRLGESDRKDLFAPGSSELEITCEYCKTVYKISRDEVEAEEDLVN